MKTAAGRIGSFLLAGSILLCRPAAAAVLPADLAAPRTLAYAAASYPQVAAGEDGLTISWTHADNSSATLATSSDNGTTWTLRPVGIFPGTTGGPLLPRVAGLVQLPGGDRLLLGTDFQEMGLLRTSDAGASWTEASLAYVPKATPWNPKTIGDGEVVADGSRIVFLYTAGVSSGFTVREVRVRVSDDGGATFDAARVAATLPSNYQFASIRVAAEGDRIRVLVWSPLDARLFTFASSDGGATWSPLALVASSSYSPADLVKQEDHAAIAVSGGRALIAFNDAGNGASLLRSSDGGATFSPAAALPQDPGFDLRRGMRLVALDADRFVLFYAARKYSAAAGRGVFELYVQETSDGGATWSAPAPLQDVDSEEAAMGEVFLDAAANRILFTATAVEYVSPFRARVLWGEILLGNTSVGAPVRLEFPPVPAVLTIDRVTAAGTTSLTRDTSGPVALGLHPVTSLSYLHLATTAAVEGGATLEVNLAGDGLSAHQARRVKILAWDGTSWADVTTFRIDGETIAARLPGLAAGVTIDLLLAVEPVRWDVQTPQNTIRIDRPGDADFVLRALDGYLTSDVDAASIRVDALSPHEVLVRDDHLRARVWNSDFSSYPVNTLVTLRVTGRMADGTPCEGTTNVIFQTREDRRGGGAATASSSTFSLSSAIESFGKFFSAILRALGLR